MIVKKPAITGITSLFLILMPIVIYGTADLSNFIREQYYLTLNEYWIIPAIFVLPILLLLVHKHAGISFFVITLDFIAFYMFFFSNNYFFGMEQMMYESAIFEYLFPTYVPIEMYLIYFLMVAPIAIPWISLLVAFFKPSAVIAAKFIGGIIFVLCFLFIFALFNLDGQFPNDISLRLSYGLWSSVQILVILFPMMFFTFGFDMKDENNNTIVEEVEERPVSNVNPLMNFGNPTIKGSFSSQTTLRNPQGQSGQRSDSHGYSTLRNPQPQLPERQELKGKTNQRNPQPQLPVRQEIQGKSNSRNEERSRFTGSTFGLIWVSLISMIISTITAGIFLPAMVCYKQRWIAKHTIIDGRQLIFDGKGIQLFGKWIQWLILTVLTASIYGFFIPIKMKKWVTSHTHFVD